MDNAQVLEVTANTASILTAVVAVWAFGHFKYDRIAKRRRLENHLRSESGRGDDGGKRTILHLVAKLGMSEAEIVDAAFRSKLIDRKVSTDDKGRADMLFLVYKTNTPLGRPRSSRR